MHGPFSGSPCPPEKWIQPAIFFPCWSFFLKQTTTHVTDSKAHIYIYILFIFINIILYIYIYQKWCHDMIHVRIFQPEDCFYIFTHVVLPLHVVANFFARARRVQCHMLEFSICLKDMPSMATWKHLPFLQGCYESFGAANLCFQNGIESNWLPKNLKAMISRGHNDWVAMMLQAFRISKRERAPRCLFDRVFSQ